MPTQSRPTVIYPNRAATLRVVFTSLLLLAVLVALTVSFWGHIWQLADVSPRLPGAVLGGVALLGVLFLAVLSLNVYRLVSGAPVLVINQQGIQAGTCPLIRWEVIERVVNYRSQSLGIIPQDRDELLEALDFRNRLAARMKDQARPPVEVMGLYLPRPITEVLAVIEEYRLGVTGLSK